MKIAILTKFLIHMSIIFFAEATSNQIHESFSQDELRQVFSVDSHAKVPEYDVVRIHSRAKRSADGSRSSRVVRVNAFGEQKTLHLKPNEGLARKVPVFFADAHKEGEGVVLTPMPENVDVGEPYQDESSRAALMIRRDPNSGHLLLDGTIGEDLVVRPLPRNLHGLLPPRRATSGREDEASENVLLEDDDDELFMDQKEDEDDLVFSDGLPLVADDEFVTGSSVVSREEQSGNNVTKDSLPEGLLLLRKRRSAPPVEEGLHVVYKRQLPLADTDYAMMELDKIPLRAPEARSSRRKRDAPYVIYPEILVLVDYDGYLLHGQDNSKIKSYYVSFWNGVDLRYKLLKNPRVKVSIAGIIISRSRDAMPYLERNRVGRDAIDSASALTDMGKYLYQERRLPTYDIAVAITKLDMCRRTHKGGKCNRGTAGFAYVGGACVVNKRLQKVNSVAIVEDTGGFSGIIVAAHEVGHLLGAVHDGSPPPSYLGGPGARHCKWKDGYIMSDLRHTERGFRWSPCSVEQFHHFLNGETATCLYNLPHEDESLPRVLPGKLLSLDAQCKKDRGTTACFKDERVCAQLFCFDSSSGFCVSYRPAAEGSDCGSGKICLNGKCVYDNENSISDVDIHREDNKSKGSTETVPYERQETTTTTTKVPFTTKRSSWWKNNNRWKKNKSTTTAKPTTRPYTPSKYKTTLWPTTTRNYKPYKPKYRPSTTKKYTPHTTTPSTTSEYRPHKTSPHFSKISTYNSHTTNFHTTTEPSTTLTTTRQPYTEKRFTTEHHTTTQRTSRETTTTSTYSRAKEQERPFNSIKDDDSSDVCEDKQPSETGGFECRDFLLSYGSRYCNHRFIEEKCCKSKREICSHQ